MAACVVLTLIGGGLVIGFQTRTSAPPVVLEAHASSSRSRVIAAETGPVDPKPVLPSVDHYQIAKPAAPGTPDVRVHPQPPSPTSEFAKKALVPLTPEEEEVLRQHPPEELGALIAHAMNADIHADDAHRAAADRRYLMLLNLAAKFDSYSVKTPPEVIAFQTEYQENVTRKLEEWRNLPVDQEQAKLSRFKDDLFRRRVGPAEEGNAQ